MGLYPFRSTLQSIFTPFPFHPIAARFASTASIISVLRIAARGLHRSPRFTLAATLALAIGIGANTAVFSLLHTVLLDPLPFRNARELVYVQGNPQLREEGEGAETYPDVREWPGVAAAFSGIATLSGPQEVTFRGVSSPERIRATWVASSFTSVMGTEPIMGRGFLPEDEIRGTELVVLISEGFWSSRLGADPEIVGKTIDLGEALRTVVGVMPDHFRFPRDTQIWLPERPFSDRPTLLRHFGAVARLAAGVSVRTSGVLLRESLRRVGGPEAPDAISTETLRDWIFGDQRETVLVFYAVACLVLLVACVNIATLFLARYETRRRELAVRASLGAGPFRTIFQALSEPLLITAAGGILGVALGWQGRNLILTFLPDEIPPYFRFGFEPSVLLVFAVIVTVSGLLFGLIPSVSVSRVDLRSAMGSDGRFHTGGRSRHRLWNSLVVLEIMLALAVLVSATLLVKSAVRQRAAEVGFDSRGVVTVHVSPPYTGEEVWEYYRRVMGDVAAHPRFTDVSLAWNLPTGVNIGWWAAYTEGWSGPGGEVQDVHYQRCGPDYFSTMGIPVLGGREFTWADDFDAPRVIGVNQAFADRYWPGEAAVGKRLGRGGRPDSDDGWFSVVALVGDNHNEGFGRPAVPQVYLPFHQSGLEDLYVVARTSLGEASALRSLRETVAGVDPAAALARLKTLDQALVEANWQIPFTAWAFGVLSLVALVLAATGVFGLVAFTVRQRSREMAIRTALGAAPGGLMVMVLREASLSLGAGVLGGFAIALVGMRLLASFLFGVSPLDPLAYAGSGAVMAGVVLLASYLPARRTLRTAPMVWLGKEG